MPILHVKLLYDITKRVEFDLRNKLLFEQTAASNIYFKN